MATAEQVVDQFTKALKSGDVGAITSLFGSSLQHNLDRNGIKTNAAAPSALATATQSISAADVKILDTIASGDQVFVRFQYQVDGKNVAGAKPGSKATVTAQCIAQVKDGKVVDAKIEQDIAGMFLELGLGIADAAKTH